jgi:hypothetical protein
MIKAANRVSSVKDLDWLEDLKATYNKPANMRFAHAIELIFADRDSVKSDASNPTKIIGKVATIRFIPSEKFSVLLVFVQGFQAWSNP